MANDRMSRIWNKDPVHHHDGSQLSDIKPLKRTDTMHSRYVQMLLDQDHIPLVHTVLASFFVWLLLAGFLVFPGTFTTLQHSIEDKHSENWTDTTADKILKSVKNVPLVVIAAIACGLSVVGMAILALRHVDNYVWLLNKLLIPGIANCLAGLISTLVGVYSNQKGVWSPMAKVTAIVEGSCLGISLALFLLFERYLLKRVKESHGSHYNDWPSDRITKENF